MINRKNLPVLYCTKCGGQLSDSLEFAFYDERTGYPLYRIKSACESRRSFLDGHTGGWRTRAGGVLDKDWAGLYDKHGKLA